jgi:hypothetical protein
VSIRYLEMKETAKNYLQLLEEARHSPECKLAAFKEKLADASSPFADNPAFQAFLELERVARLGGDG